jgi:hypothetical protein
MTTLNRFPLLGLWAKEGARRLGYNKDEAQSLGHAYAVLYAIRAQRHPRTAKEQGQEAKPKPKKRTRSKHLRFGGDDLEVTYDPGGAVRGKVGGDKPQTPRTYQTSVQNKFPPGYYEKLEKAFRQVFRRYTPGQLRGRLIYDVYDEWKKRAGVGRRVDLDRLLEWCHERLADSGAGPAE